MITLNTRDFDSNIRHQLLTPVAERFGWEFRHPPSIVSSGNLFDLLNEGVWAHYTRRMGEILPRVVHPVESPLPLALLTTVSIAHAVHAVNVNHHTLRQTWSDVEELWAWLNIQVQRVNYVYRVGSQDRISHRVRQIKVMSLPWITVNQREAHSYDWLMTHSFRHSRTSHSWRFRDIDDGI